MTNASVAVLTEEHHDIDTGLEEFIAQIEADEFDASLALRAIEDLRRHIYLEEEFLFPPVARGGLVMPVAVMLREHGQMWRLIDAITEHISHAETPLDRHTILGLTLELLDLLSAHNSKEEPVIYPQTPELLSAQEQDLLADAIASATLPQGWTCDQATPTQRPAFA